MFSSQPRVFTLFFCVALAFTLANVSAAKGPDSMNVNRRDHSNLTRLLKKRVPLPQGGPNLGALVGAAPDPATNTQSSPTSSVGPSSGPQESSSSSSAAIPTPPSPPASLSDGSSTTTTATTTTTSISSSLQSANATSLASLMTTSASPSTTLAAHTSQIPVGTSDTPVVSITDDTQTITKTATGQAQSATTTPTPAGTTSSTKKTTITVLIVVASSIAGVAVIWTIIRKWKFRPSSHFEDRMQPIDWQPTSNPDDGLASGHRRLSNASSFHSGSGHGNIDNFAARGHGYGATLDRSNTLPPLPDHDFTPGVANLAPVGGYADLARSPSNPQPQMQQALRRGLSGNGPNFAVPIHHQTAYGAQDPYGGVY